MCSSTCLWHSTTMVFCVIFIKSIILPITKTYKLLAGTMSSSLVVFICSFIFSKDRERTMFTNVNLMTTMLLGGLWHGASLRFIIWGALHGLALAVHKIFLEIFPSKDREKNAFDHIWRFWRYKFEKFFILLVEN